MTAVSRTIDRIEVTFDEPNLVANAGLLLVATLGCSPRSRSPDQQDRQAVGTCRRSAPRSQGTHLGAHDRGRRGSHIAHADVLRSGATDKVLGHQVMAPSTLGTFLRSFSFGHIRQLDKVLAETIKRAWSIGAGPGSAELVTRSRFHDLPGLRQAQRRGQLWIYEEALLPPVACDSRSHRRSSPRTNEKRPGPYRTWCRPIHRRACAACEDRRGDRTARHEVRLGLLVESDDRDPGALRRRLHDGRENGECREEAGVFDRRVLLATDRIHS